MLLGEAIAKGNWGIAVDVMEGSKLVDKSSWIKAVLPEVLPSKILGEGACQT